MSKESSTLQKSLYYAHVARDAQPGGLDKKVRRLGLPQEDEELALTLLRGRKNRLSVSTALRMPGLDLTPREQVGVIYLVSMVNQVDNHIDNARRRGETSRLREELPELPIATTTVGDLRTRMLEALPPRKAATAEGFLEDMVALHETMPDQYPPGTYGYEDALAYRLRTTIPFADTVMNLIDLREERLADIHSVVTAVQFVDDATDVPEDIQEQNLNMFVGMAKDNGELEALLDRQRTSPGMPTKKLIRTPVITHAQYSRKIDEQIDTLSTATRRHLMRGITRLYLARS